MFTTKTQKCERAEKLLYIPPVKTWTVTKLIIIIICFSCDTLIRTLLANEPPPILYICSLNQAEKMRFYSGLLRKVYMNEQAVFEQIHEVSTKRLKVSERRI